jgi:hypothetical protein
MLLFQFVALLCISYTANMCCPCLVFFSFFQSKLGHEHSMFFYGRPSHASKPKTEPNMAMCGGIVYTYFRLIVMFSSLICMQMCWYCCCKLHGFLIVSWNMWVKCRNSWSFLKIIQSDTALCITETVMFLQKFATCFDKKVIIRRNCYKNIQRKAVVISKMSFFVYIFVTVWPDCDIGWNVQRMFVKIWDDVSEDCTETLFYIYIYAVRCVLISLIITVCHS